jgi:hypothetical protein
LFNSCLKFFRSLLVLAAVGQIASERQLVAAPPGVVIKSNSLASQTYFGNPSIAILPNGDYVASSDLSGPGVAFSQTNIFRSSDRGQTWTSSGNILGQYESSLFVHDNALYLMGGGTTEGGVEFASIRKSTDGGQTWTFPQTSTTGRLVTGGNFNAAATAVVEHDGKIWRAMERVEPSIPAGNSTNFRTFVLSAPANSDLLNASNWTVSNSLSMNDFVPWAGWLEGGIVITPQGQPATFLRTALLGETAALVNISPDGTTASFDPATGTFDFPSGGSSKYTVRYDNATSRYWSLTNNRDRPGDIRNVLELVSSPNLTDWTKEGTVLTDPDAANVGFQTVDWQFDGSDIVFVSRTALGGTPSFHEANYLTFHRVPNFRSFAIDTSTTINSTNDGMIDQHVNFSSDPLGVAGFNHSHGPGAAKQHIVVGRLANDYGSPVTGPSKVGLLKFDVSGLSGELITNAMLRLVQTVDADAPPNRSGAQFAATTEVYSINVGNYDESTSTWQNFIGGVDNASLNAFLTSGAITHVGTLANGSSPGGQDGVGGVADFVDIDLTELIQAWADGTKPNLGLMLINSATLTGAPAAPGDIIVRYAAHENATHAGPQLIISHAPLPLAGDYNQDQRVDAADYVVWRDSLGGQVAVGTSADGNRNGLIDDGDYLVWKQHFGDSGGGQQSLSVPEFDSLTLLLISLAIFPSHLRFGGSAR